MSHAAKYEKFHTLWWWFRTSGFLELVSDIEKITIESGKATI